MIMSEPKEPGKIVLEDGTPVIVPKESPTPEPSVNACKPTNACKYQPTMDTSVSGTVVVPPEYHEKMREDMERIREALKKLPEIGG